MATHYFLKSNPRRGLTLACGELLKGVTWINSDVGVITTTDDDYAAKINAHIDGGHFGGLERLTEAEYNRLIAEKKTSSQPQWREELSRDGLARMARNKTTTSQGPQGNAAAAPEKPKTEAQQQAAENVTLRPKAAPAAPAAPKQ